MGPGETEEIKSQKGKELVEGTEMCWEMEMELEWELKLRRK